MEKQNLTGAAKAGDMGAAFDLILQHVRETGTEAAKPEGLTSVKLHRQPQARMLPSVPRQMGRVATELQDLFRGLVAGESPWPLFLWGKVGTGKTRAALALADYVAGLLTFRTVDDACDIAMSGESRSEIERIKETAFLVLDEIGERERVGDLQATTLKRYIDAREYHAGRVAIYISNVGPDQLHELLDDRLVSRLLAGTVFELTGRDRRRAT